jgi:hypothetical protein
VVTQAAMAFSQVQGAFSLIVTQFQEVTTYAVVIDQRCAGREGFPACWKDLCLILRSPFPADSPYREERGGIEPAQADPSIPVR